MCAEPQHLLYNSFKMMTLTYEGIIICSIIKCVNGVIVKAFAYCSITFPHISIVSSAASLRQTQKMCMALSSSS